MNDLWQERSYEKDKLEVYLCLLPISCEKLTLEEHLTQTENDLEETISSYEAKWKKSPVMSISRHCQQML